MQMSKDNWFGEQDGSDQAALFGGKPCAGDNCQDMQLTFVLDLHHGGASK